LLLRHPLWLLVLQLGVPHLLAGMPHRLLLHLWAIGHAARWRLLLWLLLLLLLWQRCGW